MEHMRTTMIFFTVALAVNLLTSCTKPSINDDPIVEHPTTSTLPVTVNKSLMLDLVNEVRKKGCQCGDTYYAPAPAVTWNTQLELAAYNHSSDMYKNDYFAHNSLDGTTPGTRIEKAGYKWTAYAENIAKGYSTERSVVESWIKSEGHCKNLMNKMYKEMGVARVGMYWAQEFGAK